MGNGDTPGAMEGIVSFLFSREHLFAERVGLAGTTGAMKELAVRLTQAEVGHVEVYDSDQFADCDLVVVPPRQANDDSLPARLCDWALRNGSVYLVVESYEAFGMLVRPALNVDILFLEPLIGEVHILPGDRVLDIGWGAHNAPGLASRDGEWVSFPLSSRVLKTLSADPWEAERHPPGPSPVDLSPDRYVAPGKAFDVVLCNGLLDRVPNLDPILWTLHRLVAADGMVLASVSHPLRRTGAFPRICSDYVMAFQRCGFEVADLTDVGWCEQYIDGRTSHLPYLQVFGLRPQAVDGPKRINRSAGF